MRERGNGECIPEKKKKEEDKRKPARKNSREKTKSKQTQKRTKKQAALLYLALTYSDRGEAKR